MKASFRITLLLVLVFCASTLTLAEDWPTYQGDNAHTGRSTISINPLVLRKAWTSPSDYSSPFVVGDTIYATRQAGGSPTATSVAAFDIRTGAQKWNFSRNLSLPSKAAYGEGFVVIGGQDRDSSFTGLYVLDSETGVLKYQVPLQIASGGLPVIHREANGDLRAYYTQNQNLYAVRLGENSGSVIWTGVGIFSDQSFATIGGESVFVSGVGDFYAFNRESGVGNPYFNTGVLGIGYTAAFDNARSRLYVEGLTPTTGFQIFAFDYVNNGTITKRWQYGGLGKPSENVAISADGTLIATGTGSMARIDPDTGAVQLLKSLSNLANGSTAALSDGYVWTIGSSTTNIYREDTLELVKSLAGSRGSANTAFRSPGALFKTQDGTLAGFVLDYGGRSVYGFDVYVVPEPVPSTLLVIGLAVLAAVVKGKRQHMRTPVGCF